MIKFKSEGKVAFTESDNGDISVQNAKLAESFKAKGANITEDVKKEGEEK